MQTSCKSYFFLSRIIAISFNLVFLQFCTHNLRYCQGVLSINELLSIYPIQDLLILKGED